MIEGIKDRSRDMAHNLMAFMRMQRKQNHRSAPKIADSIGTTTNLIYKWEYWHVIPRLDGFLAYAEALGLEVCIKPKEEE